MTGGTRAVLAAAVALVALAAPASGAPDDGALTSVIVVVDTGGPPTPGRVAALAGTLAREHGGSVRQVYGHVLGGFRFEGSERASSAIAASPGVLAVVPDDEVALTDVAGTGFFRIDAEVSVNDPDGPYRGLGARVAVIDSGVDSDHPDLVPNLDTAHWYDCVEPGTVPEDDNGHGTHVAGIAAAAFNADGSGIAGVAPSAEILPFKAFNASGEGLTSWILCAMDHLAAATTAAPMPTALNMSFEDVGTDSACDDATTTDVLHEALCDVVSAGTAAGVPVVPVAAAGNSDADAAQNIPAALSDVITVSALADHDGAPGGAAGCPYVPTLFNWECDDTLASFSNWGAAIDLAAPGVDIYSDVPGGQDYLSGTSMAAPHVTGVVALVLAEDAALDTARVRSLLARTGECPDGTEAGADASCSGQGGWLQTANHSFFDPLGTEPDPDGIPEPLVNAGRAARAADAAGDPPPPPVDQPPQVAVSSPTGGQTLSGTISVAGSSSDDHGVTGVEVLVDGSSIGTTAAGPGGTWSLPWNTTTVSNGNHAVTAVATDTAGQTMTSDPVSITVSNTAPPSVMHVGELSGLGTSGRKWTATVTVGIVDTTGAAVPNATVQFNFAATTASTSAAGGKPPPPSDSGALSCVTGTDGRCSVSTRPSGSAVRFTVTGVTRTGWTYDAAASVDGDSTTTAIDIVVRRA